MEFDKLRGQVNFEAVHLKRCNLGLLLSIDSYRAMGFRIVNSPFDQEVKSIYGTERLMSINPPYFNSGITDMVTSKSLFIDQK